MLVSGPAVEPLKLADVKDHLRVTSDDEDVLISSLIPVAREMAEQRTHRALIDQEWRDRCIAAPDRLSLGRWPVMRVTEILADGEVVDLSLVDQSLGDHAQVAWSGWRGADVVVSYRAGYGERVEDVPSSIRQWMLLQIGSMYSDRQAHAVGGTGSVAVNPQASGLLDPYRVWGYR